MATVRLFDPRHPIDAGSEILKDVLEGRDVVADRDALACALYEAAELVGRKWDALSDQAAAWLASVGDFVVTNHLAEARSELRRATAAAEAIFAAVLTQEQTNSDPRDVKAILAAREEA